MTQSSSHQVALTLDMRAAREMVGLALREDIGSGDITVGMSWSKPTTWYKLNR